MRKPALRARTVLAGAALLAHSLVHAEELLDLEEAAVAQETLTAEFVEGAITVAIDHLADIGTSERIRGSAVRILDRAGAMAAGHLAELLEVLPSLSSEERWRISRVFVDSIAADPRLAQTFVAMAGENEDGGLRLFAVRILGASGIAADSAVTTILLDAARNDPEAAVRRAALRALEDRAYGDESVMALFISLLDDADENLRLIAARGLGRAGSDASVAIPHLLAALTAEDVYPHLRIEFWRSLNRIAPDDDRIAGPEAHRGHRAGEGDMLPGLRQRLNEDFLAAAESDAYVPRGTGGSRFFSTRGWRGDEPMIPAFPEAQGFGMWTPGGRGGEVYRVTTLEDGGPGSFRDAVNADGPRIIIFDVAGTIHLQERLNIYAPYLTIAGQTAPGDGITLAGSHTQLGANDVILRNVRLRPGSDSHRSDKGLNVRYSDNVIVDQVSASWAMEEALSVVESSRVTVQRSFITHPLVTPAVRPDGRGFGSLVRGAGPGRQDYAQGSNYSYINNLWAHCRSRAPRPGNYVHHEIDPVGPLFDFRNNLLYNWGGDRAGDNYDDDSITRYNFVGNYYKPGPDTGGLNAFNNDAPHARAHFSGNFMGGEVPGDQWSMVIGYTDEEHRREEPFHAGYVRTLSAEEAYEYVLSNAGAWPRDSYDLQVVEEVRTGTGGLIDEDHEVGGYPVLRPALAPVDTNRNGIPDWWQIRFGLSPDADLNPAGDLNGTGYTNIEEYLNGTDLEVFVDYRAVARR